MRAVVTDEGRIACEKLVICAGQWAREIGRMAGVNVPLVSVQHSISITETIDGVTSSLPTLRDPDRLTYCKEEVGGLVMGGYEPNPKPWADGRPSRQFRVPAARRRSGSFRAADRTRRRPRAGAADGRHQAVHQRPGKLHARRELHPRRGAGGARRLCRRRLQRLRHRLRRRRRHGARRMGRQGRAAVRSLAGRHPPLRPEPSRHELGAHAHARGLRQALHHGLAVRGVSLRAAAAPLAALRPAQGAGRLLRREARLGAAELVRRLASGEKAEDVYSYERQNWFEAVGREHKAARERVAVFDQTSFAKFLLVGPRCRGGAVVDLPPTTWRSRRAISSTRRC